MRVAFLTTILPQYRIPFHEGVRTRLANSGIAYDVLFGQPSGDAAAKGDLANLPWGKPIINHYLNFGPFSAVWQPVLREVWQYDLAITGQESRFLTNYVMQGLRKFNRPRVALWGHGRNFQSNPGGAAELWKQFWATKCDWWFAYTQRTREIVEGYGFPSDRITVFHNSVDTEEIRRFAAEIHLDEVQILRKRLGIETDCVGVYVGGLYDHKRLNFLIDAAKEIRRQEPDFTLVVVGAGVEQSRIESAAADHSWIRYFGPLFGRQKAEILRLGKVFLMPGLVGLAVLDCAAVGLPIVTTAYPYHSPEIAYLEPGQSGLIVEDWRNASAYAEAIISLLRNEPLRKKMAARAAEVGTAYTIERMIECFSDGVMAALSAPKY